MPMNEACAWGQTTTYVFLEGHHEESCLWHMAEKLSITFVEIQLPVGT